MGTSGFWVTFLGGVIIGFIVMTVCVAVYQSVEDDDDDDSPKIIKNMIDLFSFVRAVTLTTFWNEFQAFDKKEFKNSDVIRNNNFSSLFAEGFEKDKCHVYVKFNDAYSNSNWDFSTNEDYIIDTRINYKRDLKDENSDQVPDAIYFQPEEFYEWITKVINAIKKFIHEETTEKKKDWIIDYNDLSINIFENTDVFYTEDEINNLLIHILIVNILNDFLQKHSQLYEYKHPWRGSKERNVIVSRLVIDDKIDKNTDPYFTLDFTSTGPLNSASIIGKEGIERYYRIDELFKNSGINFEEETEK